MSVVPGALPQATVKMAFGQHGSNRALHNSEISRGFLVANRAKDWGFTRSFHGLMTVATPWTLCFAANKCFTALPEETQGVAAHAVVGYNAFGVWSVKKVRRIHPVHGVISWRCLVRCLPTVP